MKPAPNSQPHVVIIDDDEAILSMMKIILEDQGYHIDTFSNCEQGLSFIKTNQPQLILLDIWMPNESGWKLAKKIKNGDGMRSIPIVFISADREVEDLIIYSHADAFLSKPFEVNDLIKTVRRFAS